MILESEKEKRRREEARNVIQRRKKRVKVTFPNGMRGKKIIKIAVLTVRKRKRYQCVLLLVAVGCS